MRSLVIAMAFVATAAVAEGPQGWLGFGFTRHTDAAQEWLIVRMLAPNGPAHRAGLAQGDVVTELDGKPLRFRDDLEFIEFLGRVKPGQRVALTIVRNQKRQRVVLTAIAMPQEYRERWKLNLEIARARRK